MNKEKIINELRFQLDSKEVKNQHYPVQLSASDANAILTMLKEQEAVEPKIQTSGSGVTWWNVCGNCQTAINPNDKYCHECGRLVKWDGP